MAIERIHISSVSILSFFLFFSKDTLFNILILQLNEDLLVNNVSNEDFTFIYNHVVSYKKSYDFTVSDMAKQVEVLAINTDHLSLSK